MLSSVHTIQACTRKSHCGCPTRASEKRREQGVFPLWFGIVQNCVVFNLLVTLVTHVNTHTDSAGDEKPLRHVKG